jgi:hypothetical protein
LILLCYDYYFQFFDKEKIANIKREFTLTKKIWVLREMSQFLLQEVLMVGELGLVNSLLMKVLQTELQYSSRTIQMVELLI